MLIKLRKAQNTAEYAIVLGLVVGAIVAMQVYVKRGLQARIHQFATKSNSTFTAEFNKIGLDTNKQYEPYYLYSQFNVTRESGGFGEIDGDNNFQAFRNTSDEVTRDKSGKQEYLYNVTGVKTLQDGQ